MRNDFFVEDQETKEQRKPKEAKNKSHRKIKTRDGGRRIEGIVSYNLPTKADNQANDSDDGQSKKSASTRAATVCPDKSQTSYEAEDSIGDIRVPGLKGTESVSERTFPTAAVANPTQGPNLAAKKAGMIRLKPTAIFRRLKPAIPATDQKV